METESVISGKFWKISVMVKILEVMYGKRRRINSLPMILGHFSSSCVRRFEVEKRSRGVGADCTHFLRLQ